MGDAAGAALGAVWGVATLAALCVLSLWPAQGPVQLMEQGWAHVGLCSVQLRAGLPLAVVRVPMLCRRRSAMQLTQQGVAQTVSSPVPWVGGNFSAVLRVLLVSVGRL